eukprot:SAG31_NODE_2893_length_4940_cov_237.861805_4_plen_248_part_00
MIDSEKLFDDESCSITNSEVPGTEPRTRAHAIKVTTAIKPIELSPLKVPSPTREPSASSGSNAIRYGTTAYWRGKYEACLEQRDEFRRTVKEHEAEVLTLSSTMMCEAPKGWEKKKTSSSARRVLASKEGSLYTTALLHRKRARENVDLHGNNARAVKRSKHLILWARCRHDGCKCGKQPCEAANLKRCPHCGQVSERRCGKADCKEKERQFQIAMASIEPAEDGLDADAIVSEAMTSSIDAVGDLS